jgi:hypothetical protein
VDQADDRGEARGAMTTSRYRATQEGATNTDTAATAAIGVKASVTTSVS